MPNGTHQKTTTHLKDLALLFAIPIVIVIFAAVVIYVPRILANPKYDFVYSTCDDYRCKNSYSVDSTGYVLQDNSNLQNTDYYDSTATLHYYDAANDSTRSLTLGQAKGYQLNTSSKSPDDYTLSRENSSGGFLLGGDTDGGWYLKNGAKKKKVELANNGSYYSQEIKFLGWVNK